MSRLYLETSRCTNIQVMLMRLQMSKTEYLILPKGTKLSGLGKLGLSTKYLAKNNKSLTNVQNNFIQTKQ